MKGARTVVVVVVGVVVRNKSSNVTMSQRVGAVVVGTLIRTSFFASSCVYKIL